MNVERKLEGFLKMALTEAEEKEAVLRMQITEEYEKAADEARKHAAKAADERLRIEETKANQHKNHEITKSATEIKKKITNRRAELITELFRNVENRFLDYTKTEEYVSFLIEGAKAAVSKYGSVQIELMERDMGHNAVIEAKSGAVVLSSDEDFLGGFRVIVPKKDAILDCTFKDKLKDEQRTFSLLKI